MKRVYGEIYGEDSFSGVSVPFEMKYILEFLVEQDEDTIIGVYDSYEEYKEQEVEMSHYAKDGSSGTEDLNSIDELKKWFFKEFDWKIKSGRISAETLGFIMKLEEINISDVLTDEEAIKLLDEIIENSSELENTEKITSKLLIFRDKWFNQVI